MDVCRTRAKWPPRLSKADLTGSVCDTIVMVRVKLKIIAIVVVGLIVASVAILYATRNRPVIYRSGAEQSGFIIQNPFRERGPEDEAAKLLQDLKNGNCERALTLPAADAGTLTDRCAKERANPLESWSLTDRQDFGKQSILVYKVSRHDSAANAFDALAWIDVEKAGEDRWLVLSYQAYY